LHAAVADDLHVPDVPRKSSKRHSWNNSQAGEPQSEQGEEASGPSTLAPTPSRLPFERTPSQKRLSGSSAGVTDEFIQVDLQDANGSSEERPAGYGFVTQGSVGRVDREVDLLGSSAEVVDGRR
jgi:hypothetical protein